MKTYVIVSMTLLVLLKTENTLAEISCHTNVNFQNLHDTKGALEIPRKCRAQANETCTRLGTIRVAYFEMKPYTVNVSNSSYARHSVLGIIQRIMGAVFAECCGTCAKVNYIPYSSYSHLTRRPRNESDVRFPILSQGSNYGANTIIPLVKLSATFFITKPEVAATEFGGAVFTAIKEIWPLLGLSMLLAYVSGVCMWMVDTWSNKEQFPRSFLEGSFEGFWWSFISMTTVGYGDKSPKSLPAKLFACFWILCGITIISLLTAALTTAIESVSQQLRPTIYHGHVGILANHLFEMSMVMKGNAKITYKNEFSELIQALNKGEVNGVLVDIYTIKCFENQYLIYDDDGLCVQHIEEAGQSYVSIAIYDRGLYNLINEYIEYQRESIGDFVHHFSSTVLLENNEPRVTANIIFTTRSGIFQPLLLVAGVMVLITISIGITYELFQKKRSRTKVKSRASFQLTPESMRKEEERLEFELREVLLKWHKQKLSLIDNYIIHGNFTKADRTCANVMVNLSTTNCSSIFLRSHHSNINKQKGDLINEENLSPMPRRSDSRTIEIKQDPTIKRVSEAKCTQTDFNRSVSTNTMEHVDEETLKTEIKTTTRKKKSRQKKVIQSTAVHFIDTD